MGITAIWEKIDTIPRDKLVLVWSAEFGLHIRKLMRDGRWFTPGESFIGDYEDDDHWTHWTFLPDDPIINKEG